VFDVGADHVFELGADESDLGLYAGGEYRDGDFGVG
jgi:hypothetical protein